MISSSTFSRWTASWRSTPWGKAFRLVLGTGAWALFLFLLLFTATLIGWMLLGLLLVGSASASDADISPAVPLLVLVLVTGALGWVIARFFASVRIVGIAAGSALLLLYVIGATWARSAPDAALFVARDVGWGTSDVWDYQKFSQRAVNNAPIVMPLPEKSDPALFGGMTIDYKQDGVLKQAKLAEFLQATQTTSFLVVKDGAIVYEGYFNGYARDSIVTSFSMAKSVTSALIGIAIDEGHIGSVNDPVVWYLPELRGRGLDDLTVRQLLLMSSGIRYVTDDEISGLAELSPFADDAMSYSYPNLRSLALSIPADGNAPGTEYNYNNYDTLLLGILLERATHMPVAQYLETKIWKPLGMEYPASWSLDSAVTGFEATLCCVNARAVDFAKFGVLMLDNGKWNGKQVISEQWVKDSTSPYPNPNGDIVWRANTWFSHWKEQKGYYKYQWWGKFRADGGYDFLARGHLGQYIYVSPQTRTVVVRFGISDRGVDAWEDVLQSVVGQVSGAD